MKPNSYKILEYLKLHNGATANEVAKELNMEKRLVDSYFFFFFLKNDLGYSDTTGTPATLFLN